MKRKRRCKLNPNIYFFEIQNKKAGENTSFEYFLRYTPCLFRLRRKCLKYVKPRATEFQINHILYSGEMEY